MFSNVKQHDGSNGIILDSCPDISSGFWYFGARLCPYANRVWWCLLEKDLEEKFIYVHINLGEIKPQWYYDINPLGTLPCIYYNGKPIYESLIICKFINEQFTNIPALLPYNNLIHSSMIQFICNYFNESYFYSLIKEQDKEKQKEKQKILSNYLKQFNNDLHIFIPNPSGPYICGEFSLADISIFPFIDRFIVALKYYRDYDLNIEQYDRLYSSWKYIQKRSAFKKTSQSKEFYISVYKTYANPIKPKL